ncbi:LysM peptidoglycan-binding domain-containing protein [Halomonas sp. LS-001]
MTVQSGDTLGEIAQRVNVPIERLQRFNPDVDPRRLVVGQSLLIPFQQERAPLAGPYRYQIRPGDTFAGIARHFGVRTQSIINANPGVSPTALRIGQLVSIPVSGSSNRPATPAPSATAASGPPPTGNLPDSARRWPWPLEDYRIVRRFGPDDRGTLQPMLLATQAGAKATAVAPGDVRFAGSMRQLGKVVIVHHQDNLQSVYALCETLLVEEGTRVATGDVLCDVGLNRGGRHDLLFDLRQGGNPIDPRRVLK